MADLRKVAVQSTTVPTDLDAIPKVAAVTKKNKEPQAPPSYKPGGTIVKVKRLIDPAQSAAEKKPADTIAVAATNGVVETVHAVIENDPPGLSAEKRSTPNSSAAPKTTSPPTEIQPREFSSKSDITPQKASAAATTTKFKQQSTRPFFSAFAVRAIPALISSIRDIGDLHDEDEIVDDGDSDSDSFDDDDDKGGYDDVYEKEVGDMRKTGESGARILQKTFSEWTRYIIWSIMVGFPILFIVLGALTAILSQKDNGDTYEAGLSQAIKVATSTWPIIFAAIVTQTLRTIASYKVERGIRLLALEQLMGSNSVASSIKQPFLLRKFDRVTIALLALWGVSPLATQALQRMYTTVQKPSTHMTTVWYLNTWQSNVAFGEVVPTANDIRYGDIISDFFDVSILPSSPDQAVWQDLYLRPKVPIIEKMDLSDALEGGWVDNNANASSFSSFYGIPIERMPSTGDYSFMITSSYLHFDCSFLNKTYLAEINKTWPSLHQHEIQNYQGQGTSKRDIFMTVIPQNRTSQTGSVIYASSVDLSWNADGTDQLYTYSVCQFNQSFVDSMVNCYSDSPDDLKTNTTSDNGDCYVDSVRKTPNPPPISDMSNFIIGFLPTAGELLDNYLWNPNNLTDLTLRDLQDISQVVLEDFETRLALLINTYWQLGFGPIVQNGGLDHTASDHFGINANSSPATVKTIKSAYSISIGWLVVLLLCSVILLLAGITSIILDTRTIAPDILGFVSTLVRKSKYVVNLPKVNSSMGGAQRAHLMAERRVMIQDVEPNAAVGRVALGLANGDAKRLERGRRYR